MVPIYTIGTIERREASRKHRTIVKEKHLIKISSIVLVKEKVPCSIPVETVCKIFKDNSLQRPFNLRPFIPISTVCKEWIDN